MTTIQQQIDYYRARTSEYDEWFYRVGRYDRGEADNQQWLDEVAIVFEALHSIGHVEKALELAGGTGFYSEQLIKIADDLTVIDASPQTLAINKEKLGNPNNVTYRFEDLFAWQLDGEYDLASFTFLLSHVPPSELDTFIP